jgi:hypothetical protein
LSDSSNSGLEELLLERRELWPNAPPQAASVKERELPRFVTLAIEIELGDNAKDAG